MFSSLRSGPTAPESVEPKTEAIKNSPEIGIAEPKPTTHIESPKSKIETSTPGKASRRTPVKFRLSLLSRHEEVAVEPSLEDQERDEDVQKFFDSDFLEDCNRFPHEVASRSQTQDDPGDNDKTRVRDHCFLMDFLAHDAQQQRERQDEDYEGLVRVLSMTGSLLVNLNASWSFSKPFRLL